MYRKLMTAQQYDGDPEVHARHRHQQECRHLAESSSRFATYLALNPELEVHSAYSPTRCDPDFKRKDFGRFRLSAHRLYVECGRWSRVPRQQRARDCDGASVQDEAHVALHCQHTQCIRDQFNVTTQVITDLFTRDDAVDFCSQVLNIFDAQ